MICVSCAALTRLVDCAFGREECETDQFSGVNIKVSKDNCHGYEEEFTVWTSRYNGSVTCSCPSPTPSAEAQSWIPSVEPWANGSEWREQGFAEQSRNTYGGESTGRRIVDLTGLDGDVID